MFFKASQPWVRQGSGKLPDGTASGGVSQGAHQGAQVLLRRVLSKHL